MDLSHGRERQLQDQLEKNSSQRNCSPDYPAITADEESIHRPVIDTGCHLKLCQLSRHRSKQTYRTDCIRWKSNNVVTYVVPLSRAYQYVSFLLYAAISHYINTRSGREYDEIPARSLLELEFFKAITLFLKEKPTKKTMAVFLDMTSAFDRAWRKKLLERLHNIGVRGKTSIWIADFLRGRRIKVRLMEHFPRTEEHELVYLRDLCSVLYSSCYILTTSILTSPKTQRLPVIQMI
ncbi:hypothetical protein LAZ67_2001744 [Cordylochernes scorpioides]|uniref:Reverse transcriptase domain-containing protein n=1 Tax=Cordylochernes scorpioides TaxID=51811 RepID=A0ABY6K373_9ARAC|nr:hypothetical protein LAZ67_2001744 [Cordylochernes scorpioides]